MEGVVMAGVRQIPELYLRGSLANITMAHLTTEQKSHIEQLFPTVANHPEMIKHKYKAIQKFGSTIAGDYRDDRTAAEEEYNIAIWKGLVDLFYHRKYSFKCKACDSDTYLTKRSKPKSIDRIQKPCPNCGCVLVTKSGSARLVVGSFVNVREYQNSYRHLQESDDLPECDSTIEYIALSSKYPDPYAILNDPKQLKKFFGEFVWNYFRQHISENQKKKSRRINSTIIEKADIVYALKLFNICDNYKIKYTTNYDPSSYADIHITFKTNLVQPECTLDIAEVLHKAGLNDIRISIDEDRITVHRNYHAVQISETVAVAEHVQLQESDDEIDNFNNRSKVSRGGVFVDVENHIETVEMIDIIENIRESLPDGDCKDVFDIKTQIGERYKEFAKVFGDGEPKANQIAIFLGVGARVVTQHISNIKLVCLAKGISP